MKSISNLTVKLGKNSYKIIIDKNGKVADTFSSITKPSSKKFIKVIENLI